MNGSKLDCKRKTPHGENLFMEEKVSKIWIGRPEPEYRYIQVYRVALLVKSYLTIVMQSYKSIG